MDEMEKALSDCNDSIRLNPGYVKALNNKATTLIEMGEVDEALQLLK